MATLKALIITPDGNAVTGVIENHFKSFQKVVGGYIQALTGSTVTVYVNEEGLLQRLPYNDRATAFSRDVLGINVPLVGTALILGPTDSEGNDTDVRPAVVDYFKEN